MLTRLSREDNMITRETYLELSCYAIQHGLDDAWLATGLGRIVSTVQRRELSRSIAGRSVRPKSYPATGSNGI